MPYAKEAAEQSRAAFDPADTRGGMLVACWALSMGLAGCQPDPATKERAAAQVNLQLTAEEEALKSKLPEKVQGADHAWVMDAILGKPKKTHDFDAWIAQRGFANRSEAVRDLLRSELERSAQREHEAADCMASLSYVYRRGELDVTRRLTSLQHEHHDLVPRRFLSDMAARASFAPREDVRYTLNDVDL